METTEKVDTQSVENISILNKQQVPPAWANAWYSQRKIIDLQRQEGWKGILFGLAELAFPRAFLSSKDENEWVELRTQIINTAWEKQSSDQYKDEWVADTAQKRKNDIQDQMDHSTDLSLYAVCGSSDFYPGLGVPLFETLMVWAKQNEIDANKELGKKNLQTTLSLTASMSTEVDVYTSIPNSIAKAKSQALTEMGAKLFDGQLKIETESVKYPYAREFGVDPRSVTRQDIFEYLKYTLPDNSPIENNLPNSQEKPLTDVLKQVLDTMPLNEPISSESIASLLKLSKNTVDNRLKRLKKLGFTAQHPAGKYKNIQKYDWSKIKNPPEL